MSNAPGRIHRYADALVLAAIAGLVLLFLVDAAWASASVVNLVLILPISVVTLALCAVEFFRQLRSAPTERAAAEPAATALPLMAAFAAYVLTLPWLGVDVGTFLFVAICLWLLGERRVVWTLGYSLVFSVLVAWFFAAMSPSPLPLLLLSAP